MDKKKKIIDFDKFFGELGITKERLRKRMSSKFAKKGLDDCWRWIGAVQTHCSYRHKKEQYSYGIIIQQYKSNPKKQKSVLAHRLAYWLEGNKLIDGLEVCHRCGNKLCVNPNHLYQGTHAENMKDIVKHGKSLVGDKNPMCKIKDNEIPSIIKRRKNGESAKEIANSYNVHEASINFTLRDRRSNESNIVHGNKRCSASTKYKKRCKNTTLLDGDYCGIHMKIFHKNKELINNQ